jgi:hypothetical protein
VAKRKPTESELKKKPAAQKNASAKGALPNGRLKPQKAPAPVLTKVKPVRRARIAPPPAARPINRLTEVLAKVPEPETKIPVHFEEPKPSAMIDLGLPVPDNYGFDRLVAAPRDPHTVFSYWELHGNRLHEVRNARGQGFIDLCAWVLRLYRLNEGVAVDMEIDPSIGNWYVDVGGPGRYQLELALLSPDGEWITLLVSQIVETPAKGPSDVIDEEWAMRPEDEELLLRMMRLEMGSDQKGGSGMLGASRVAASFGAVSSMAFPGSSFSGRPVAGSWVFSALGASERVSGSGSGSGGFGWLVSPTGAHEPVFERPTMFAGPNWNEQSDLPVGQIFKTRQPHFKVKLPRRLKGVTAPAPTWPPVKASTGVRRKK